MKIKRSLLQALRSLQRYRLRTAIIMLAGLVGIAALTFVLSVGQGAVRKISSTVRQIFGDSAIIVIAGGQSLTGGPRPDAARLTLDDLDAVAHEVPAVEAWDPQQALTSVVRHGNASTTVRLLGQSERSEEVWARTVSRGVYFDANAVKRLDRVALLGETAARALFGDADPLGAEIMIDAVPFTVIGVLERFGTDFHGMDRDNEIVVPVSTLMRRLANLDSISLAKFKVKPGTDFLAAEGSIRRILRTRHSLATAQVDDFTMLSPVEIQRLAGRMRRVLSLYLPLASVVILLVGGIIAAALMVSSVNARTSEIGVRRALGALPGDISRQFLIETTLSLGFGGVLGIVLGGVGTELIAVHMRLDTGISWFGILVGLIASAATGLLAGVLPARRAAQLQPVDALK